MCGIFGIISEKVDVDFKTVDISAKKMNHRGPDAFDQWNHKNFISLAHLRLSIIDLSKEGNQPFISDCKNFVIIFNGEIFNYLELKETLVSQGVKFRTLTDTEVLLNAYIKWGESCVKKFNGDWAFAIYDIQNNSLFCSRDRFGVKPFNYALFDGGLIFSSEIKSIINYFPNLKKPNYNIISNFCRNSLGAHTESTWFESVKRLMPAHNLIWRDGVIKIYRYWDYPTISNRKISFDEAKIKYKELFINAVNLRMRSDVPVGTTLSSGIDSGSIVSIISEMENVTNHKTYTAVFDNKKFNKSEKQAFKNCVEINEGDIVKKLSDTLKLDSTFVSEEKMSLIEDLSKIIYHLESGHSSYATLPLYRVLDAAKKDVTVVMEGQGADELLGGYVLKSFPFALFEYFKNGKFNSCFKEFKNFKKNYSIFQSIKLLVRLLNSDLIERIYSIISKKNNIYGKFLKKYKRVKDYPYPPSEKFNDGFNKELFKSHTGGLVNLLHYGDAISMSKSMESRNPFLDVNLVEYSFTLPYNFKIRNGMGKYIHRIAMEGIVPQFILQNPIKFGFITPLSYQFESYETEPIKILLSQRCLERNIFSNDGVRKIINDHIIGKQNHSPLLFRLLSVELWFRCFIDNE